MSTEAAQKQPAPATPAPSSPAGTEAPAAPGALSRSLADNVISAWLGRHEFVLRRLHSLTGGLFGLYVILHLVVSATLAQGQSGQDEKTVYQLQVDRSQSLPLLGLLVLVFVLLPILFHSIYGIVVLASARPNVDRYGYAKNWAWLLQRLTAVVLVLFIAFHYLSMKGAFGGEFGRMLTFVPVDHATQSVVNHVHAAWWVGWFLYPLGIISAAYHTAYGFWTAAITWGFTVSSRAQRVWLRICIALCVLLLACGFAALGAALAGDATDEPLVGRTAPQAQRPADEEPVTPRAEEGADGEGESSLESGGSDQTPDGESAEEVPGRMLR